MLQGDILNIKFVLSMLDGDYDPQIDKSQASGERNPKDGHYDNATRKTVKRFKKDVGLVPIDSTVDHATWN